MPLHYILDGYNIIKNNQFFKRIKNLKDGRIAFLRLLQNRSPLGKKIKITVVFDGKQQNHSYPLKAGEDIEVVFTQNETADDWIKRRIKSARSLKDTVVISDDKEIVFFAKAYSVNFLSVEEFLEKLLPSKTKSELVIKPEISYRQALKINEELKKLWIKD